MLVIVSMSILYCPETCNVHIKGGNVLLEPAVSCHKLLLTISFSIKSVPDMLLLNKIGERRVSHCYCKLALLQWSRCLLISKGVQSEYQTSSGPCSAVKCSQLIFYKKGTSKLSTVNISPQQNCASWVTQGLFFLYSPPEKSGSSRMGGTLYQVLRGYWLAGEQQAAPQRGVQ